MAKANGFTAHSIRRLFFAESDQSIFSTEEMLRGFPLFPHTADSSHVAHPFLTDLM